VNLVHLVGFVTKKFVTMQHGHMNAKLSVVCFKSVCFAVRCKNVPRVTAPMSELRRWSTGLERGDVDC